MGYNNSQQQQQAKTAEKNVIFRQKKTVLLFCLTARKNVLRRADDLANEHTTLFRNLWWT